MKMLLMIYGRVRKQVDDSGLFEMEAITLTISQKNLDELTLAQSAMIAGLPKAPSKYNPITNPERAKERRDWILKRMLSLKFIEKYDFEIAIQDPVTASLHGVHLDLTAPYVAEEARRVALEIFDSESDSSELDSVELLDLVVILARLILERPRN